MYAAAVISTQELSAQLAALPKFQPTYIKKELAGLHEKMQPGETVLAALGGTIKNSQWLCVATDRRLVLLLRRVLGGEEFAELGYEAITAFESKLGLMMGELRIVGAWGTKTITGIVKADCKHFVEVVTRLRAEGARGSAAPGVTFAAMPPSTLKPAVPKTRSKLGMVVGGLLVIGVCGRLLESDTEHELPDQVNPGQRPATANSAAVAPAPQSSDPPRDACSRAAPLIERACPGLDITGRCQVAAVSQTTLRIEELGPGDILNIGVPGPEWFLTANGTLIAVNGVASGACRDLPDVPGTIGQAMITNAPRRGDSEKTYEGTINKAGHYTYPDCSAFEIRVGRIMYHELMSNPDVDENVAMRRGAKKANVKLKTANDIFSKTSNTCLEALTKP